MRLVDLALRGELHGRLACGMVYVAEAHADDEWPIGSLYPVPHQHRTHAERRAQLTRLCRTLDLPAQPAAGLYACDSMGDEFLRAFNAWPTGFYVFRADDGALVWNAVPRGAAFDVDALLCAVHDACR